MVGNASSLKISTAWLGLVFTSQDSTVTVSHRAVARDTRTNKKTNRSLNFVSNQVARSL